jgi:hypothetical protein
MKCETKAKRRVTLSICGLGMLDETELETISGSKQAQADYLAPKGLEPYTAPPKNDVRTASEAHKALIVETAKMLDEPPSPDNRTMDNSRPSTKTIEMRHAKTVAEADAAISQVAKPDKRKITAVSIEIRKAMTNIKDMLREATGDDTIYRQTLKAYGFESSKDIPTKEEGRVIYKAMAELLNRVRDEKKLRAELELSREYHGNDLFMKVLGANGCESLEDCLSLSSEPLEALRRDLKQLGGAA